MGIDLSEGGHGFHDLAKHVGHNIHVTTYGDGYPENIAVECLTCNEILVDFDRPTNVPKDEDERLECDTTKHKEEPKEPFVIVAGNVIDGLRLFGPYDDAEEANKDADHHIRHASWVVAEIKELREREKHRFLNKYQHCGVRWISSWTCVCNDRCPECGAEIEPYESEDLV